jgi:hypothetical protein
MAAWIQVILALLRVVNAILDYTKEARAKQAGKDEEIARESAAILRKTQFASKALEEFSRDPSSVDDFLRSLEPPGK